MLIKRFALILFIALVSINTALIAGNEPKAETQISGFVVDEQGNPMAGVAVRIQGIGKMIYTNLEGEFQVKTAVSGKLNVAVSTISYNEIQLILDTTAPCTPLRIQLNPASPF